MSEIYYCLSVNLEIYFRAVNFITKYVHSDNIYKVDNNTILSVFLVTFYDSVVSRWLQNCMMP